MDPRLGTTALSFIEINFSGAMKYLFISRVYYVGAIVPAYVPTKCTVRELFLHHLDIRSVPRKVGN